jgi:hypothetical protein
MPWKPAALNDLERKIHALQVKLLQTNSALKLKTDYCERLEFLLRQRNQRVDQLFAQLERACTANRRLEAECEHLASLIANDRRPQAHIAGPEAP